MNPEVGELVQWMWESFSPSSRRSLIGAFGVADEDAAFKELSKITNLLHVPKTKKVPIGYFELYKERLEETLRCSSFPYFITTVLEGFEMSWHHLQWCQIIHRYKKSCVLAARNHGKSYLFSFAYPLWRMYRHKGRFEPFYEQRLNMGSEEGIIITNEMSLSLHFLKKIIEEIEGNQILKAKLYPTNLNSPTRVWGKRGIACANGAKLLPFSALSRLRGRHPNWIVLDDFLDDSCLHSPEQREKFIEIFDSVVLNTLQPGGHILVVGTPFHKSDLYGSLRKRKTFHYFEYPAIYPDGKVLWSSRFSLDDLLAVKEDRKDDPMSEVRFSREFLVRPVDSNQTIFPHTIIQSALNPNIDFVHNKISGDYSRYEMVITGCDFAISSSFSADYTVFVTIAKDKDGRFTILHIYREKGVNYTGQIQKLIDINNNLEPDRIVLENNGFQEVMFQMAEDAELPVTRHTTTSNKYSLAHGIPMVAALFEKGVISIPYKDGDCRATVNELVKELGSFSWAQGKIKSTALHDDMVLALWIAVKGCRDSTPNLQITYVDTK